jgi:hypothetical protein
MKTLPLVASTILASGCGFALTPGAISCGLSLGLDVYVDGVSVAATSKLDPVSGGQDTTPAQAAMVCATALAEVVQARDLGAAAGFWGADATWSYRLEFVNQAGLAEEGASNAQGDTAEGPKDSAVSYSSDDATAALGGPAFSTVTLVHEMLHMSYGENSHAGWAARYAPSFAQWPNQAGSTFVDSATGQTCVGSVCR